MAEIVNLTQARKAKMRRLKQVEASANRRKFGRTKAERLQAEREETRDRRAHEGRKIEPESEAAPTPEKQD